MPLSDHEISAEISRLEQEMAALRARPRVRFVDDAHTSIDATVALARQRIDSVLANAVPHLGLAGGEPYWPVGIGDAFALAHFPEIAARWHALVDEQRRGDDPAAPFPLLTRAEYETQRDAITAALDRLRAEQALREAQAAASAATRRVAELEGASR